MSNDRVRERFARILERIVSGELAGCPSDTGLDDETVIALNNLGASKQAGDVERIAFWIVEAKDEFRRMLDGTHLAQHRDADRAFFQRFTP